MPEIIDPDSPLVLKAQQGDAKAFSLLVIKYQNVVAKVLYGYLRDRIEVEDGVQEVFLKVWKTIHSFQGRSKFFTWLYRITINMGLTLKDKSTRRNLKQKEEESIFSLENFSFDPVKETDNSVLKQAIDKALQKLPPLINEAISLREIDGLNYQAIAEIQDVPVGTVRSRLSRGRKMLAESLKDWR